MYMNPRLLNTPVMIDRNYIDSIISLDIKALKKLALEQGPVGAKKKYIMNGNSAVIQIMGPLSKRLDFWSWLFGGSSYDNIRAAFKAALADNSVDNIILEIDSPGGTVAGVFDLVDYISAARGQKKIIASINETAYSAAYAIASAADVIYIPRTGNGGSIGVIAFHTDISKWEEKTGIKYTPIFAGKRKNDFSPHEPLSEEAYAVVKAEVDDIYDIFVKTVARNRGLTKKAIRDMEAGIYQGKKAIDAGLADKIGTFSDALKKGGKRVMSKSLLETLKDSIKDAKPEEIKVAMLELGYVVKEDMISKEAMKSTLEAKQKEFDEQLKKGKEEAAFEGAIKERTEIIDVLEYCSIAGMEKLSLKFVTESYTKEKAREEIMSIRAKNSNRTINSTVNPLNDGDKNPLLADAKRRAGDQKK